MLNDLRYALRMLLKSPGFTLVVVLSLALGIGANTAIFSLIDAVLVKMLPVKNPEQLVFLSHGEAPFSYSDFVRFRDHNQVFSALLAFTGVPRPSVGVNGQSELAWAQLVSGNYYSALGINAVLGRTLTAEDDKILGGHPVAVISYAYWKRRFGLDLSAVGKAVTLNGTPFTIIGVTPPEFFGLQVGSSADISIPLMMQAQVMKDAGPQLSLTLMGRLKPGVTEQQARADLDVIYQQILTETVASLAPNAQPQFRQELLASRIELLPGSKGLSELRRQFSQPLLILMAVVGLVLLIACANVANLLLARAMARQKEIALRLALGAGRLRLVRQLLTESMLLALLGGALGLLLASFGTDLLLDLLSNGPVPILLDLYPDARVLGFTGMVSLLTGILFGLAPALRATRLDLTPALKENARSLRDSGTRMGLSQALVVLQVGLSLVLLIGAGLFVRTLQKLESFYPGFNREKVLLFSLDPTLTGYQPAQIANLYKQLLEQVNVLPGVQSASLASASPIGFTQSARIVSVQGYTPLPDSEDLVVRTIHVGPKYFETLRVPLLGRDFGPRDSENAPRVAVINQTMARHYFPNDSPLGKRFGLGGPETSGQIEIVGVVQDSKVDSLREQTPRLAYLPFLQHQLFGMTFVVRTMGNPSNLISAIRHEIQAIDKNLPVFDVKTLSQQVDGSLIQERLVTTLSSFFGLLGLVLASVGLYGTMSYAVVRRTSEIGIRMALGARQGDVLWMVMRETMVLVLIGATIGLVAALATTRLISSLLFGLTPTDPLTISLATLLLVAVALFAGYLPARRASHVDPLVALRYE